MWIDLVADRLPLVESRVPASHSVGGHVRVLGEVVTATGLEHDTVEAVQQVAEAARRTGHVERQRPARLAES